ncbi:Transposon Tf2-6 polyprotein [Smittium culicis]|uniref:Transposon Tf2-6 polyprotein n=1 Tax=Smittium culicis TaxID=133412 RepID=A0A1R1Y110_9FUNG|nr:Transposon Tf2-6 polyprotein [Smittium culicis]
MKSIHKQAETSKNSSVKTESSTMEPSARDGSNEKCSDEPSTTSDEQTKNSGHIITLKSTKDNYDPSTMNFNSEYYSDSEFSDEDDIDVPPMPKPNSPSAPYFDGTEVDEFVNHMKKLAIKSNIGTKKLAKIIPNYCSKTIATSIRTSLFYKLSKWNSLKNYMINTYQETDEPEVSKDSLKEVLSANWNKKTAQGLSRNYKDLANYLIKRKLMSEDESVESLMEVLPNKNLEAGYLAQGERIYSNVWVSLDEAIVRIQRQYQNLKQSDKVQKTIPISSSEESKEIPQKKPVIAAVDNESLPEKIKINENKKSFHCIYCDDTKHSRRECMDLKEDHKKGKITIDWNGSISLPNGAPLRANFGNGGMKIKVNEYFNEQKNIKIGICEFIEGPEYSESKIEEFDILGNKHVLDPLESDKIKVKKEGNDSLQQKSTKAKLNINKNSEIDEILDKLIDTKVCISLRNWAQTNPIIKSILYKKLSTKEDKLSTNENGYINELTLDEKLTTAERMISSNVVSVDGTINDVKVKVTIDTGAMMNLISKDTLKLIENSGGKLNQRAANYMLKGLYGDGKKANLELPDCQVTLGTANTSAHLIVSDSESFQILLGMPWYREARVSAEIPKSDYIEFEIDDLKENSRKKFLGFFDNRTGKNEINIGTLRGETLNEVLGERVNEGLNIKEQILEANTLYKSVKIKVKPANEKLPIEFSESPGIKWNDKSKNNARTKIEDETFLSKINLDKGNLSKEEIDYFIERLYPIKDVFATNDAEMGLLKSNLKDETLVFPGVRRFIFEHIEDVFQILTDILEAGLTISATKSKFGMPYIDVVGFRCDFSGRRPLSKNIEKTLNWSRPKNLKEARGFVALAGYYRNFMPNFSIITDPLYELTRKGNKFRWGAEQEESFNMIKEMLNSNPILRKINPRNPLVLTIDASPIGAGGVLGQDDEDGRYACRYESMLFNQTERKKKIAETPKRILRTAREKLEVLNELHSGTTGGHRSKDYVFNLLRNRYFWKKMYRDCEDFVKTCGICQFRNGQRLQEKIKPTLDSNLFEIWSVDCIVMPVSSKGNKILIVSRDDLSGWTEAAAIPTNDSKNVSEFLFNNIICRYGCIPSFRGDRGELNFKEVKKFIQSYGITVRLTSSYHPQANGMIEKGHQTIVNTLAKYSQENNSDWEEKLNIILWAERITVKRSTGYSPYEIVFGQSCILPVEYNYKSWRTIPWSEKMSSEELLLNRVKQLEQKPELIENAIKNLNKTRLESKRYFESRHRIRQRSIEEGKLVLLHDSSLLKSNKNKLHNRWRGPFKVIEVRENDSYILSELDGAILRHPQPGNRIKEFYTREFSETTGDRCRSVESDEELPFSSDSILLVSSTF